MCPEPRRERDRGGRRQPRRVLLVAPVDPAVAAAPPARTRPAPPVTASPRARAPPAGRRDARPPSPPLVRQRRLAAGDRQSVGWGKRASVRANVGGRRILKKQNK